MQGDHLPNPQRFEVFTELSNGKGFRIKDSKYIYLFDKYGGFYDEYNNYYNVDGEPEDAPSDEDDDFERVVLVNQYEAFDDHDYYDQEYGGYGNGEEHSDNRYEESYKSENQKTLESISQNQVILHQYPVKTPLRVDFENVSFKATKQDILKHYKGKVGAGILNVILTKENGRFNGSGYIVCKQVSTAEKLIKYQAEEFIGRKVFFDVQPLEQCLADPVTKQEMDMPAKVKEEEFESLIKEKPKVEEVKEVKEESKNPKKKYFSKNQVPVVVQDKKQQQKTEVRKVPQIKSEEKKKQEFKQPTWSKYQGDIGMFPKKSSFKDWMKSMNFDENEHFKNPEKVQSNDPTKKFATVMLRSDVYEKIEGKLYENQKVHFEKLK